jgi:hypothetical protein
MYPDKNEQPPTKTYTVVSDYDGNDSFEVEASNYEDALIEALRVLGWWLLMPKK